MSKHVVYKIVTIWYILMLTIPPLNLVMPFKGLIQSALFCGVALLLFPNLLGKKSIITLLIYTVMTFVYYIIGHASFKTINNVVVPFLLMLSALLMIEYAFKYDSDFKYTRSAIFTLLLGNVLMCLISIPQLIVNPIIIRMSTTIDASNAEEVETYSWVMSYATVHGLPLLFAPLVFLSRKKEQKNGLRFLLLTIMTLFLATIVLANATTPLILSVVVILVAFYFKAETFTKKSFLRIIVGVVIAIIILQPPIIIPIIELAQRALPVGNVSYERLEQIKETIIYGETEGDLDARQTLYQSSSKLFLESPFWGTSTPEKIGNHSWIRDKLACFGIIFIIPLVCFFVATIKSTYKRLKHSKATYTIGIVSFIFLLYMKAAFGVGSWLYGFAFLPLLCRYIDYYVQTNVKR